MKLKSFIIASLIIHVIGGIALYFYYNPIRLSPQPARLLEEGDLAELKAPPVEEEPAEERRPAPQIKKSFWQKAKERIRGTKQKEAGLDEKKDLPAPPQIAAESPAQIIKKKPYREAEAPPIALDLEESPALPLKEAKSKKPSPETESPPIALDLEEIEESPALPLKEAKSEKPSPETEGPPIALDLEEIEESPAAKQKISALSLEEPENNLPQPSQAASGQINSPRIFSSLKQKIGNPSLSYPDFARRNKMQGTVSLLFFVTEAGLVDKIQIKSSSGHKELDNFVIRALARYEFLPGSSGWVQHDIPFILEGEETEFLRLREKGE